MKNKLYLTLITATLLSLSSCGGGGSNSGGDNSDNSNNTSEDTTQGSSTDSNTDNTTDTSEDSTQDSTTDSETDNTTDTSNSDTISNTSRSYAIVDTNQSLCFNSSTGSIISCTGTGYDADYTGNQPSYSISEDNLTVTDNITGLIWTRSPDLNADGNIDSDDKRTQTEAVSYCANLNQGGFDDWRLPDIKTLYSLMDFSGKDPSGYNGTDSSELSAFMNAAFEWGFGDTNAGERIIDGQYATSTLYVSTTMNGDETMFGVNFVDGRIKGYPTNNKTFYVHCTRGNEEYGLNSYTDNGDDTISDSATGLMWQKNDAGTDTTNWDGAVSRCESATTAGYSDWRLPNAKELHSLMDYSRSPDTSYSAAMDSILNATSFVNEEGETDWASYWTSSTHQNYLDSGNAAAYIAFGRALGYMNNDFMDVHGAGAQRSDDKTGNMSDPQVNSATDNNGDTFYYKGPQGDILRVEHQIRCVRDEA